MKTKFAASLAATRVIRKLSAADAAKEAGVSRATYYRAERGGLPDVMTFRAPVKWARLKPEWALIAIDAAPCARGGNMVYDRGCGCNENNEGDLVCN